MQQRNVCISCPGCGAKRSLYYVGAEKRYQYSCECGGVIEVHLVPDGPWTVRLHRRGDDNA